jgi:hypothetical protein
MLRLQEVYSSTDLLELEKLFSQELWQRAAGQVVGKYVRISQLVKACR